MRCGCATSETGRGRRQFYSPRRGGRRRSAGLTSSDLSGSGADAQPSEAKRLPQAQATLDLDARTAVARRVLRPGPQRAPGACCSSIHHLAVDGVSWRSLLEDLERPINSCKSRPAVQLPAKTTSFKAWAERLSEVRASERCRASSPYWNSITGCEQNDAVQLSSPEMDRSDETGRIPKASART